MLGVCTRVSSTIQSAEACTSGTLPLVNSLSGLHVQNFATASTSLILPPSSYTCSHYFTAFSGFGFLRKSSFGSGAKTAAPSPLHQTALKSTNRLSRPNVIKSEPGSGTVNAPALPAPREQSSSSASPSLAGTFISMAPAPRWIFPERPLCGELAPAAGWLGGGVRGRLSVGSLHRARRERG